MLFRSSEIAPVEIPRVRWAEAKDDVAWREDWDFGDDELGGIDDESPFGSPDDIDVPSTDDDDTDSDDDDSDDDGDGAPSEDDEPRPPRRAKKAPARAKAPAAAAPRSADVDDAGDDDDDPDDDEDSGGDDEDEPSADEDAGHSSATGEDDDPHSGRRRSKTIARKQMMRERRRMIAQGAVPEIDAYDRPGHREQCRNAERPCLFVSCRYHLYLDVNPATGSIKLNFPDKEVWQLEQTCALDVAERGGITLEEVGDIMNLTRERIRQVEVTGLGKLKSGEAELETFVVD